MAKSTLSSATIAADALAQAEPRTRQLPAGASRTEQPLLGVPIAIKDVLAVKDHPLNCASKILGKFISPYDATVIAKTEGGRARLFSAG